jgi:hypothetical protein
MDATRPERKSYSDGAKGPQGSGRDRQTAAAPRPNGNHQTRKASSAFEAIARMRITLVYWVGSATDCDKPGAIVTAREGAWFALIDDRRPRRPCASLGRSLAVAACRSRHAKAGQGPRRAEPRIGVRGGKRGWLLAAVHRLRTLGSPVFRACVSGRGLHVEREHRDERGAAGHIGRGAGRGRGGLRTVGVRVGHGSLLRSVAVAACAGPGLSSRSRVYDPTMPRGRGGGQENVVRQATTSPSWAH